MPRPEAEGRNWGVGIHEGAAEDDDGFALG